MDAGGIGVGMGLLLGARVEEVGIHEHLLSRDKHRIWLYSLSSFEVCPKEISTALVSTS